jgi:hypothetical protein
MKRLNAAGTHRFLFAKADCSRRNSSEAPLSYKRGFLIKRLNTPATLNVLKSFLLNLNLIFLLYALLFFTFILISVVIFMYRITNAYASSVISVKISYIKRSAWIEDITVPGMVHSTGKLVVSAPFTGRIIESFLFPSHVSSGTVIARVIRPGLDARIISAKASVEYAKMKLKRIKLLFRDGVMAKKDEERAALSLADAYSRLRSLEAFESEGVLISHFKGTVHYLVPDDAIVSAGISIAVLNGKGKPWIAAYVTPSQSFKLYDNMQVSIKTKHFSGAGKIISIGNNAIHNGLVPVYVNLPEDSSLLPGEWVKLSFNFAKSKTAAKAEDVFSLPKKAIVMLKGETFVFIIKHNKTLAVKVKVIGVEKGTAYVKGNIRLNEPVIVYPVSRLISGILVEIRH